MTVTLFRPYEHRTVAQPVIEEAVISATEKIYKIAEQVRFYLRERHSHLFAKSLMSRECRAELLLIIADYIKENADLHIPGLSLEKQIQTLQNEIVHLGPIQDALDDPTVSNIEINGPYDIYLEVNGEEVYRPDLAFQDEDHLYRVIDKMLLPMGKSLTANEPHVDSQFEGFRICAVLGKDRGGICSDGPAVSIRKFSPDILSDEYLIETGTLNEEIIEFFKDAVPGGSNIIIGGSTNSGKTTTLIRLPLYLDKHERIITIEDSPEMMLRQKHAYKEYRNIVALETKPHEKPSRRYDIAKLTGVSLRMRPFKIIIGEVRFSEAARQAHEAMNTGHALYMTIHCSSARHAAIRIVQLAGDGYNDDVIAAQLADNVDLIFFQQKIKSQRIITEIVELIGYEGAKKPIVNPIFRWRKTGEKDGKVLGCHERVGTISASLAEKWRNNLIPEERIRKWQTLPGTGGEDQ
ncbi:CpaF family protein [Thermincola potens]|uniref:Type II secretion system protein E n=1 Tax=Thermincola potens (strain JR) TaxID=635013 RepID=D5XCQ4_THEPJ|nr:ATPase, T2SS/T4P/T4SS family [Thermincola potens]ADG81680.1 type II secretion system protein E [Thermincola potens JR]